MPHLRRCAALQVSLLLLLATTVSAAAETDSQTSITNIGPARAAQLPTPKNEPPEATNGADGPATSQRDAGALQDGPGTSEVQPPNILKFEPPPGHLRAGEIVYVDDGACPKEQIKQITGGSNMYYKTTVHKPGGLPRQRKCVNRF